MPDNRDAIYADDNLLPFQETLIRFNVGSFNNQPAIDAADRMIAILQDIKTLLATNAQENTGALQIVQWGSANLPPATSGQPYSFQFQAEGGTAPYTWAASAGIVPAGLTLGRDTGLLSGTCLAAPNQTDSFVLILMDAAGGFYPQGVGIHIQ